MMISQKIFKYLRRGHNIKQSL